MHIEMDGTIVQCLKDSTNQSSVESVREILPRRDISLLIMLPEYGVDYLGIVILSSGYPKPGRVIE